MCKTKRAHSWGSACCEFVRLNSDHGANGIRGGHGRPRRSHPRAPARRRERPRARAAVGLASVPLAHCRRGHRPRRSCCGAAPLAHVGFVHRGRPLHHDGDGPGDNGNDSADGGELWHARTGQPGESELRRLGNRDRREREGRSNRHGRRGVGHGRHDGAHRRSQCGPGSAHLRRGSPLERRGGDQPVPEHDRLRRSVGDVRGVVALDRPDQPERRLAHVDHRWHRGVGKPHGRPARYRHRQHRRRRHRQRRHRRPARAAAARAVAAREAQAAARVRSS